MNIVSQACDHRKTAAAGVSFLKRFTQGMHSLGRQVESPILNKVRQIASRAMTSDSKGIKNLGKSVYDRISKFDIGKAIAQGNTGFAKDRTGFSALVNKIDDYVPMTRAEVVAKNVERAPQGIRERLANIFMKRKYYTEGSPTAGVIAHQGAKEQANFKRIMDDIWSGSITPDQLSNRVNMLRGVSDTSKQKMVIEAEKVMNNLANLPIKNKEQLMKLRTNIGEAVTLGGVGVGAAGLAGAHELEETFL